jgi:hypothetical protein
MDAPNNISGGMENLFILQCCGFAMMVLLVVGFVALAVGKVKARGEFRNKGYLRAPSGRKWFPFLLYKQYDGFDDPGTRFYFGISHGCLVALMFLAVAVAILLGCEFMLTTVASGH